MRCLILGGDGMLGHQLWQQLAEQHEVWITVRNGIPWVRPTSRLNARIIDRLDVRDFARVTKIVSTIRPEVIVNAVGIVKQRPEATDPALSFAVNTVFPHQLLELAQLLHCRVVHISTDCVFSGRRGYYNEKDPPDADDLYGVSKRWGELHEKPAITLRTSIIGLELKRRQGLVEWFLAQRGTIPAYERAVFSGLTTFELSRVIARLLVDWPDLDGLWHVASEPIRKAELLRKLTSKLRRQDIDLRSDCSVVCDRSLDGRRFAAQTGYQAPSWDTMLDELVDRIILRMQGGTGYAAA